MKKSRLKAGMIGALGLFASSIFNKMPNFGWARSRKKGSGRSSRARSDRSKTEAHLYGNKLARKAFRGVMTIKSARK